MLSPGLVVVGQTEQVVLLRPGTSLVVLQNRLDLRGIGEQMLVFGIKGSYQEGRHTDIGFDNTDLSTGILHLLAVFLRQRVGHLLLPFHLVLLDDRIHQQLELSVNKRLTSSLRRLDIHDETGGIQLAVTIFGTDTSSQCAQHRHRCDQGGFLELLWGMISQFLKDRRQFLVDRSGQQFLFWLSLNLYCGTQHCEHLFHL